MTTKLTLSIDKKVIERAKHFARKSNRSVSDIVESYLRRITDHNMDDMDSELMEIQGIIKLKSDYDEKEGIRKILIDKHLE